MQQQKTQKKYIQQQYFLNPSTIQYIRTRAKTRRHLYGFFKQFYRLQSSKQNLKFGWQVQTIKIRVSQLFTFYLFDRYFITGQSGTLYQCKPSQYHFFSCLNFIISKKISISYTLTYNRSKIIIEKTRNYTILRSQAMLYNSTSYNRAYIDYAFVKYTANPQYYQYQFGANQENVVITAYFFDRFFIQLLSLDTKHIGKIGKQTKSIETTLLPQLYRQKN
eukprot:TRINITY_DN9015_c0_g1_i1.p1 TRINITY_DN9015_c0_g1~~TRINITY_DN9015_c0_g1_i1.p1  ORF type:complete len:220 (-),score=-24.64 TRINITY_DN9015_c0_g1_i1:379-1038(-)